MQKEFEGIEFQVLMENLNLDKDSDPDVIVKDLINRKFLALNFCLDVLLEIKKYAISHGDVTLEKLCEYATAGSLNILEGKK